MIQRLCIHLGDCKTGTTAIQTVLKTAAYESPQVSVDYPIDPGRLHHCVLASTLFRPRMSRFRDPFFARIAKRLRASEADLGILSAEWFEFVEPEKLDAALREHLPEMADQVRLIAYVRPHAERVLSSFQERTKLCQFDGTLAQFHNRVARSGRFLYAERLRRWREVFGDRYEVRPMLRERLRQGDVVQDFLDHALQGAPFSVEEVASSGINVSLGVEDLAWMRAAGRGAEMTPNCARRLARAVQGKAGEGERLRLDRALLAKVRATYLEDAKALDAEFFHDGAMVGALDQAEAQAVETPQNLEPEHHFSPEEIARAGGVAQAMAEGDQALRRMRKNAKAAARDARAKAARAKPGAAGAAKAAGAGGAKAGAGAGKTPAAKRPRPAAPAAETGGGA